MTMATCSSVRKDKKPEQENPRQNESTQAGVVPSTKDELEKMVKDSLIEAEKGNRSKLEYLASDLFLKANDASVRGESEMASFLFANLFKLKPEDSFVMKKYAVELIRLGKLEEAKNLIVKIVDIQNFKDLNSVLLLGGVYTALEDEKSARSVYEKVLKEYPGNEEACVFIAKIDTSAKLYAKAHRQLKSCDDQVTSSGIFSYYRGKVYLKQGKNKLAEKFFKAAVKKEKNFYQGAMALGLMREERGDIKSAVKVYQNFLKTNPDSYPILSRLIQVMFSAEMYEGIIPYAEQLIALDQSDLNLKVKLGILYSDVKRYDDAIGTFKEILMVVPDSDKVLYYLGSLYQETREPELALETFSRINDESSLYMDSSMQIAQLLRSLVAMGDEKRENEYIKFLENKRKEITDLKLEFSLLLAKFYEEVGKYENAIEALVSAENDKNFNDNYNYYLASLYEKIRQNEKARNIVEKILVNDPNNADALNFIGYSLLEEGQDMTKAYEYIKRAVEISPEDGYIRDSLAWYYYKVGNLEEALAQIQKAWSYVKDDSVINKHMAMIYASLNQYDMARKYYSRALQFCKLASEKKEIRQAISLLPEERLPASHP